MLYHSYTMLYLYLCYTTHIPCYTHVYDLPRKLYHTFTYAVPLIYHTIPMLMLYHSYTMLYLCLCSTFHIPCYTTRLPYFTTHILCYTTHIPCYNTHTLQYLCRWVLKSLNRRKFELLVELNRYKRWYFQTGVFGCSKFVT